MERILLSIEVTSASIFLICTRKKELYYPCLKKKSQLEVWTHKEKWNWKPTAFRVFLRHKLVQFRFQIVHVHMQI